MLPGAALGLAPPLLDAARRSTWEPRGSFLLAGAALQALDGARARFGAPPLMLPGAALGSLAAQVLDSLLLGYVNSVLQCFYGCGPLREDIAGQPSPKGPLAALVQQLFRRLSGRDGQWDYVAPAAVLRQVFLTNEAAFQPGDSADILDCCHLFLHSCLSHSGLYLELPQRAGVSS